MNKQDIIAKDAGLKKVRAAAVVDSIIDGIPKSLKKGVQVSFVGFGTFKISNCKGARGAQLADQRGDQDPQAPGPSLLRRQALRQAVK